MGLGSALGFGSALGLGLGLGIRLGLGFGLDLRLGLGLEPLIVIPMLEHSESAQDLRAQTLEIQKQFTIRFTRI